MACISHRHQFIFLKTRKTASTSVEMLLEPYCHRYDTAKVTEATPMIIGPAGIIGSRLGGKKKGDAFYSHMTAQRMVRRLSPRIFRRYHKIATVRNPYAVVVSMFHYAHKRPYPRDGGDLEASVRGFEQFIRYKMRRQNSGFGDHKIVHFQGRFIVDSLLRFECLSADIQQLAKRLELNLDPDHLPRTKVNSGAALGAGFGYSDYFRNPEIREFIFARFRWAFQHGHYDPDPRYQMPKSKICQA